MGSPNSAAPVAAAPAVKEMTCAQSCYKAAVIISVVVLIAIAIISALAVAELINLGHLGLGKIAASIIGASAATLAITIIVSRLIRCCYGEKI